MPHAGLARRKRRVGIEVEVGSQNLREALIDNDGAVHFGKLEQAVAGEGDVQREAVVTSGKHILRIAHADEGAKMTRDNHVECGADGLPGSGKANGLVHTLLDLVLLQ